MTISLSTVHVIVDDPDRALSILTNAKFTTKTTDVLAVTISDKVGSLADILAIFERDGINIEYLYAALEKVGETAVVIFKVEDLEKGLRVVESNGLGGKASL